MDEVIFIIYFNFKRVAQNTIKVLDTSKFD